MDFEGEIEWKEALERYQSDTLHVDLPFEHGCRVKVQLPMMSEPVYGVLWRELDGNQNWYNFLYPDGTKIEETDTAERMIDLSYQRFNIGSEFSTLDWLERADKL